MSTEDDNQYHYRIQLIGMIGLVTIAIIAILVGLLKNDQGIITIGAAAVGGIAGYLAPKPN